MRMRILGPLDLLIYTILIILFAALVGCSPVFVSTSDVVELYSKPAGGYGSERGYRQHARSLVWVWAYDATGGSDAYYPVHAARTAEQTLIQCGFSSAGVAVASSYGERMSPPHQFRLDLRMSESPGSYRDHLGSIREYRTVRVDARMVRPADNTLIMAGQGHGAYGADGIAHDIVQSRMRIYASAFVALQKATEAAVRSVCGERRGEHDDAPSYATHPYDAPSGQTLMGYGACGKTLKSGAWDLHHQHSSVRGCH